VAASGYESLQMAAISCSHLQPLAPAASDCFFENQNDARLPALCFKMIFKKKMDGA